MDAITYTKLENLQARWKRIFERLQAVQAKYDLETRAEERIRLEPVLEQDRKKLADIEREIDALREQPDRSGSSWQPDGAMVDAYGRYADLTVNGVTQRLRWIEPGTFLMGSPPGEAGRSDNELQHEVTLTQGFWLADTACTQALWQAVMGKNPSGFNAMEHPVGHVDWNKVQDFLDKLNALVGGLKARLPTEAEWEYACRAGTTTAFAFGDTVTAEQTHVRGKQAVAVKALPANPWGLYGMHGNVWEWCQDDYGKYPAGAVIDPLGDFTTDLRVLRGGSWDSGYKYARSAARGHSLAGNAASIFGFRFAAT
ncbi:Formylglycine-generating enzyme, required for sulfatase activity, contains SUMF1/FGE domain [Thiothrix caldifontis]|uniref:Formylglycine-generating enzyme, required for sulfatase activity, contains SUMF1/FGE domain n=1 Tax=Thiothrix caldifontis TaxID=525918 RepID=A0A1H4AQH9_9GAMM|nr:SUMF1/EgtB/PvdO family nonheme iron enzyme [Thiothrix caldifontis]SEA38153.1 Formylglycine-generating enzyme, required for sulfatase activity, contains SUMF1/FGE domain [Thiothrix caldifontis]